jgi:hypothetical protein
MLNLHWQFFIGKNASFISCTCLAFLGVEATNIIVNICCHDAQGAKADSYKSL